MVFLGKIKSFLVLLNINVFRLVIFFVNKLGYFIVGMNNIYENYWNFNFVFLFCFLLFGYYLLMVLEFFFML